MMFRSKFVELIRWLSSAQVHAIRRDVLLIVQVEFTSSLILMTITPPVPPSLTALLRVAHMASTKFVLALTQTKIVALLDPFIYLFGKLSESRVASSYVAQ